MKIFIPIKHNSQRVPRKNFRELNGVPLYKHTLYKLKDYSVYVDTDSDEIMDGINSDSELKNVNCYRRRENLIGDEVSVCDLISNFIDRYIFKDAHVCQIHVTSPFLTLLTLEAAYDRIKEGYDSVASCNEIHTRFWRKEEYGYSPINHNPMKLEQTQDLPTYYEENSNFYIFSSENFKKTKTRIGFNPYFYTTEFPENMDIDTEDDWKLAEIIGK